MKVRYWWTEDGDAEVCERAEGVAEEDTQCYHCSSQIKAGTEVSLLTSSLDNEEYIMCVGCADKNTQAVVRE